MLPHLGAGASVGIEVQKLFLAYTSVIHQLKLHLQDAYILASLLTEPSTPRALSTQFINRLADIYNAVRVPPAIAMSKATIETGYLCHLETPMFAEFKEGDNIPEEVLRGAARAAGRNWAWTNTDPEEDRRIAVKLLGAPRAML